MRSDHLVNFTFFFSFFEINYETLIKSRSYYGMAFAPLTTYISYKLFSTIESSVSHLLLYYHKTGQSRYNKYLCHVYINFTITRIFDIVNIRYSQEKSPSRRLYYIESWLYCDKNFFCRLSHFAKSKWVNNFWPVLRTGQILEWVVT